MPVSPAQIRFRIVRFGKSVVPWRNGVDLRTFRTPDAFHVVFGPETRQNHPNRPGLYCYNLAHDWNSALHPNGSYRIDVEASDIHGNRARSNLTFSIVNGQAPGRPVTYSIVGCDLEAREWGVAVQSKFLAVGSAVPFAAAEVGAIATQALANVAYGPDGLALLREGQSASDVVAELTRADDGRDDRQLGVVDAQGGGATFTGSACVEWAGGLAGACYAAQGNILVSGFDRLRPGRHIPRVGGLAARRAADRLPRGGAGGRRRSPRAAVGRALRRPRGWGLRRSQRPADRSSGRRAPSVRSPSSSGSSRCTTRSSARRPVSDWIAVDEALATEIESRLAALGYRAGSAAEAFSSWADTENLEERVDGFDAIDPVVLDELRKAGQTTPPTFATRCAYRPPRQSGTGPLLRAVRNDEGKDSYMRRRTWTGAIAVATSCALIGAAGGIASSGAATSAGSTTKATTKTTTRTTAASGTRPDFGGRGGGPSVHSVSVQLNKAGTAYIT